MKASASNVLIFIMVCLTWMGCGDSGSNVECRNDIDCPPPQFCINSKCVNPNPECIRDSDCADNKVCLNGTCVDSQDECTKDEDCIVGEECQNGHCVESDIINDFTLSVLNDPVDDGQAQLEVIGLEEDFIPTRAELFLDKELFYTPKQYDSTFTIGTLEISSGQHELRLRLTDENNLVRNGKTNFNVQNPAARVTGAQMDQTYVYPGETLEFWLDITGNLDRIEPDFSAIDANFSLNDVTIETDNGRYKISYTIPQSPTGAENYYTIPISVIGSDQSVHLFEGIGFYLGAGPLLPFVHKEGLKLQNSIVLQNEEGATLFVDALNIPHASVITGGTLEIEATLSGDTEEGQILIGCKGWGGHLKIDVASLKKLSNGNYEIVLELPVGSLKKEEEFFFQAVARDRNGFIGYRERALRKASGGVHGSVVNKAALQISVEWPTASTPDVDLFVKEPDGSIVYWSNPTSTHGSLDIDANSRCVAESPPVNKEVYNNDLPSKGKFFVKVGQYKDCDNDDSKVTPVAVTIKVEGCGHSWSDNVTLNSVNMWSYDTALLVHEFECDGHYTVEGKLSYEYWPMKGHPPTVTTETLANIPIKLFDKNNNEIATTEVYKTDTGGNYKVTFPLEDSLASEEVQLKFYTEDSDVKVVELKHNASDTAPACCTGDADKVHMYAHPTKWKPKDEPVKKLADATIPLHDSGAFHVFRVMKQAKKYYDNLFKTYNTSYPTVVVETLKGKKPHCGSSYTSCFSSSTNHFYLLGDPGNDQDYYDDGIMLHELGHYVMKNAAKDNSPGGSHKWKWRIPGAFAWSEGIATYLAQSIIETNSTGKGKFYCDRSSSQDGCVDITQLSDTTAPKGTATSQTGATFSAPSATSRGLHSEARVLMFMWDLLDSDNDSNQDPVEVDEKQYLKWVFDKSSANVSKTMQTASNLKKGEQTKSGSTWNDAEKADMPDLIHLWGCSLTESTKPKLSELKKLMKDRHNWEWLDEANFCP